MSRANIQTSVDNKLKSTSKADKMKNIKYLKNLTTTSSQCKHGTVSATFKGIKIIIQWTVRSSTDATTSFIIVIVIVPACLRTISDYSYSEALFLLGLLRGPVAGTVEGRSAGPICSKLPPECRRDHIHAGTALVSL